MADSKIAIAKTLIHEGGYQNDVKDWANWRGGKVTMLLYLQTRNPDLLVNLVGTNYGITAQDMPNFTAQDMKALTPEKATEYYVEHYWKTLYSQINDQPLAEKLFDMGVLFGVGTAIRLLQISLQAPGVIAAVADGQFGPITLAQTNDHGDLTTYRTVLLNHCMDVVNRNPDEAGNLHGWTTRITS